jgi:negative regulator of flagellin synthesis FlgM
VNSPIKLDPSLKKATGLGVGTTQSRGTKEAEKAAPSAPAQAPATDSVHLSSQLQSLSQVGGSSAPFDAKKVEEIKAAIAEGRFQVDPEKVANGLLDTVTDLIQSRKK